jgi:hypothetical protein
VDDIKDDSMLIVTSKGAPVAAGRSLARVGLHFTVPYVAGGGAVWHGKGPHECYSDRQWGALLGQHSVAEVADLHVPYIVPGD